VTRISSDPEFGECVPLVIPPGSQLLEPIVSDDDLPSYNPLSQEPERMDRLTVMRSIGCYNVGWRALDNSRVNELRWALVGMNLDLQQGAIPIDSLYSEPFWNSFEVIASGGMQGWSSAALASTFVLAPNPGYQVLWDTKRAIKLESGYSLIWIIENCLTSLDSLNVDGFARSLART